MTDIPKEASDLISKMQETVRQLNQQLVDAARLDLEIKVMTNESNYVGMRQAIVTFDIHITKKVLDIII